jgi:hypothetical protein
MSNPQSPIEWLHNQILWESEPGKLRQHALTLLSMVDNDQVQGIYQEEMMEDGCFDDDKETR